MHITRRLKGNIIAVCLAFLLSVALYSGVTNYTNLATDIRGATGVSVEIITDITVTIIEQDLVISSSKDIPEVESLSMLFVYDTDTVRRSDDVVSSYDRAVSEGELGEATVIVTLQGETIARGTELLTLGVNGSPYDIVVADIVATFVDGSSAPLTLTMP